MSNKRREGSNPSFRASRNLGIAIVPGFLFNFSPYFFPYWLSETLLIFRDIGHKHEATASSNAGGTLNGTMVKLMNTSVQSQEPMYVMSQHSYHAYVRPCNIALAPILKDSG